MIQFFCFFFQAEDGIRAGRVTGVQTCALPISELRRRVRQAPPRERRARAGARPQRSEERREGKSVDLGGRRIIKKKKEQEREIDREYTEKIAYDCSISLLVLVR